MVERSTWSRQLMLLAAACLVALIALPVDAFTATVQINDGEAYPGATNVPMSLELAFVYDSVTELTKDIQDLQEGNTEVCIDFINCTDIVSSNCNSGRPLLRQSQTTARFVASQPLSMDASMSFAAPAALTCTSRVCLNGNCSVGDIALNVILPNVQLQYTAVRPFELTSPSQTAVASSRVLGASVSLNVTSLGPAPALDLTVEVDAFALVPISVGVKNSTIATGGPVPLPAASCDDKNCSLPGLFDPEARFSLDGLDLMVPVFFQGDVSLTVSARLLNSPIAFYLRMLLTFENSTAQIRLVDGITRSNESGVVEPLALLSRETNVTSAPSVPMAPRDLGGFLDRVGTSLREPTSGASGVHFVIWTALSVAFLLAIAVGANYALHTYPIPSANGRHLARLVAAQHLWLSVILPCHRRCATIHATQLGVSVLAVFASISATMSAAMSFSDSSMIALCASVGAATFGIPRALTAFMFRRFVVDVHTYTPAKAVTTKDKFRFRMTSSGVASGRNSTASASATNSVRTAITEATTVEDFTMDAGDLRDEEDRPARLVELPFDQTMSTGTGFDTTFSIMRDEQPSFNMEGVLPKGTLESAPSSYQGPPQLSGPQLNLAAMKHRRSVSFDDEVRPPGFAAAATVVAPPGSNAVAQPGALAGAVSPASEFTSPSISNSRSPVTRLALGGLPGAFSRNLGSTDDLTDLNQGPPLAPRISVTTPSLRSPDGSRVPVPPILAPGQLIHPSSPAPPSVLDDTPLDVVHVDSVNRVEIHGRMKTEIARQRALVVEVVMPALQMKIPPLKKGSDDPRLKKAQQRQQQIYALELGRFKKSALMLAAFAGHDAIIAEEQHAFAMYVVSSHTKGLMAIYMKENLALCEENESFVREVLEDAEEEDRNELQNIYDGHSALMPHVNGVVLKGSASLTPDSLGGANGIVPSLKLEGFRFGDEPATTGKMVDLVEEHGGCVRKLSNGDMHKPPLQQKELVPFIDGATAAAIGLDETKLRTSVQARECRHRQRALQDLLVEASDVRVAIIALQSLASARNEAIVDDEAINWTDICAKNTQALWEITTQENVKICVDMEGEYRASIAEWETQDRLLLWESLPLVQHVPELMLEPEQPASPTTTAPSSQRHTHSSGRRMSASDSIRDWVDASSSQIFMPVGMKRGGNGMNGSGKGSGVDLLIPGLNGDGDDKFSSKTSSRGPVPSLSTITPLTLRPKLEAPSNSPGVDIQPSLPSPEAPAPLVDRSRAAAAEQLNLDRSSPPVDMQLPASLMNTLSIGPGADLFGATFGSVNSPSGLASPNSIRSPSGVNLQTPQRQRGHTPTMSVLSPGQLASEDDEDSDDDTQTSGARSLMSRHASTARSLNLSVLSINIRGNSLAAESEEEEDEALAGIDTSRPADDVSPSGARRSSAGAGSKEADDNQRAARRHRKRRHRSKRRKSGEEEEVAAVPITTYLRKTRLRPLAYAANGVLALTFALVTLYFSAAWDIADNERTESSSSDDTSSVFWTSFGIAVAVDFVVAEFLFLVLTMLFAWVSDDRPFGAAPRDLLETDLRHPFDGEEHEQTYWQGTDRKVLHRTSLEAGPPSARGPGPSRMPAPTESPEKDQQ